MSEDKTKELIKKLYELKPLELMAPDNNSSMRRVPGGWVYSNMQGTTFVPFHNEFQLPDPDELDYL